MSAYRGTNIRKRSSDDESSSDSDVDLPSVKRKRTNGSSNLTRFTSKCHDALKWIMDLPVKGYFKDYMLSQAAAAAEITDVDTEDEEVILVEDNDDDDIAVISDTDAESPYCEEEHSSYLPGSRNGFPKPVITSTPFYRDGTMVGFKPEVSPLIVYSSIAKTKDNSPSPPRQRRLNGRCIAPVTNPGIDIELMLNSRELKACVPDELQIVSEIGHRKQSSKYSRQLLPSMYNGTSVTGPIGTSHRSTMNGKDSTPSTSRQDSKSFCKGYTAHEVVRLQEKAQYGLLLDKIVKNSIHRPVRRKGTTAIQVDLTRDENDLIGMEMPFKKELLQKPVEDFLAEYYKPCQLVTKIRSNGTQLKKSSEINEDVKEIAAVKDVKEIKPVLPEYKIKTKAKPNFFDANWINELKISINEETKKRMKLVNQEEFKVKRFQENRDAKIAEERRLFEKYKVPGDVFPELFPEQNDYPVLTEGMLNLVNRALERRFGGDNDELSTLNGVTVTRKHIYTLVEGNWLIDEVLNFYFNLLVERSKLDDYPSVYSFNTFFFSSLKTRGINSVLRWTRKVDIFSYDILFVPLHLEVHWALCVVDNRSKNIQFLDSMSNTSPQFAIIIQEYLIAEKKAKKGIIMEPDEYTVEVVRDLPKQMNGSDCGMFALKYAEYISRDVPITFKQAHINYFRRRMVYEIMSKTLL